MKTLYTATVEIEMMVVAETLEEARRVAARSLRYEVGNLSSGPLDFDVVPATQLAEGWEADALPYGDEDSGLTVCDYLAQPKAPAPEESV